MWLHGFFHCLIFFSCITTIRATVTCSQLRAIYSESDCCGDAGVTECLHEIPNCSDESVIVGQICSTAGKLFVKGSSYITITGNNPETVVQNSGMYTDAGAVCWIDGVGDYALIHVSGDIVDASRDCGTTFTIHYDCPTTDAAQVSRVVTVECP